jgi:hypothetical protein
MGLSWLPTHEKCQVLLNFLNHGVPLRPRFYDALFAIWLIC